MVAVEDLMVGEIAVARVVIDEARVDGLGDAHEMESLLTVFEDCLDTVELLWAVAEDVESIAFEHIVAQVFGDEVEVLVPLWLGCGIESDD